MEYAIARMKEEAMSSQDTAELESEVIDLHTECARLRGERMDYSAPLWRERVRSR